jgi:hypothetical protein
MVMRQIQLLIIFLAISLTGCHTKTGTDTYPNSDAVYLNLTKTFILNEDGTVLRKTKFTQKLLTYRAFNGLYGETRINYNPAFEQLKVTESYTKMASGKRVPTPGNGYNEVLPHFGADSKAYNHLREMVVTHTGLEREATIHCGYEIARAQGETPFLAGDEPLVTTCPIEKLKIVIKVPRGTQLNYSLLYADKEPDIKKGTQADTYTWKFSNLPQHLSQAHEPGNSSSVPRLLFSTLNKPSEAMELLARGGFSDQNINATTAQKMIRLTGDKKTIPEKALAVQRLVVNDLNLLQIPTELIAYKTRPAQQIWDSNSGTLMEKSVLMVALLRTIGIDAEVGLGFPPDYESITGSFLSVATPFLLINPKGRTPMRLSAAHLNDNSSEFKNAEYSVLSLKSGILSDTITADKGAILITGNLTLNKNGMLNAALQGKFTDAYNPYYKIQREASTHFFTGLKEKIKSSGSQQSEIAFAGPFGAMAEIRGGYCFVSLPQCSYGIASKHLMPLTLSRHSELSFGSPLLESYQLTLSVPKGWQLINDLLVAERSTPEGNLSIKIEPTGNIINIFKQIEVIHRQIGPDNYLPFKDLINLWQLKKYNQLVFRIPETI